VEDDSRNGVLKTSESFVFDEHGFEEKGDGVGLNEGEKRSERAGKVNVCSNDLTEAERYRGEKDVPFHFLGPVGRRKRRGREISFDDVARMNEKGSGRRTPQITAERGVFELRYRKGLSGFSE